MELGIKINYYREVVKIILNNRNDFYIGYLFFFRISSIGFWVFVFVFKVSFGNVRLVCFKLFVEL